MSNQKPTMIQLGGDSAKKLKEIKAQTRLPLKQLGNLAIQFFVPAFERGEIEIVNGQVRKSAR